MSCPRRGLADFRPSCKRRRVLHGRVVLLGDDAAQRACNPAESRWRRRFAQTPPSLSTKLRTGTVDVLQAHAQMRRAHSGAGRRRAMRTCNWTVPSIHGPCPAVRGAARRRTRQERDGAGEKSRTPDLRITNALLYQLSYAGVPTRDVGKSGILADPQRHSPLSGGAHGGSAVSARHRLTPRSLDATKPQSHGHKATRRRHPDASVRQRLSAVRTWVAWWPRSRCAGSRTPAARRNRRDSLRPGSAASDSVSQAAVMPNPSSVMKSRGMNFSTFATFDSCATPMRYS